LPRRRPSPCETNQILDVLVVNAGSTSLKLSLVRGDEAERVESFVRADAVGHRVVHGGERLVEPVAIDDAVEREIAALSALAPLHNRPAVEAIERARAALPDVPHVAVFDTAFHRTLPPEASTYAVPERWRSEWGIRRYGFHGIAVQSVAERVRVPRLVVCHLGGGCSVTAVRDGRSVDTTMGFSPLEGVPMATRSGSIDPGALVYLLRERRLSLEELDHALEHESGLAGLSGGGSGDVREASPLALDVFVHRVAGAVASMAAALGGIDALAFSGGIGEHADEVRERIVERVRFLGAFAVEVVPAREELVIARAVRELVAPTRARSGRR
jgi:acetate kinase